MILRSREVLALDPVALHPRLGRFILVDGLDVVAGGSLLAPLASERSNLVPASHLVDRETRASRNGHRGAVIWMTGLPGAGKTTLAMLVERRLHERRVQAYVLDGDNVRAGLCADLGFSAVDRTENIRRVGHVAALFADAGIVAIAAFISPRLADRQIARGASGDAFHEVYVKADAALCERRDPKGDYARARAGEIDGFTGITGDYEEPLTPELVVDTGLLSIEDSVASILR